ncbi:MAG: hypothetical protein AAB441_05005 [Patescibacteria group bacterium]
MSVPTTFVIACLMELNEFKRVSQMIRSHEKPLPITITSQQYLFDKENMFITFVLSRTICIPSFFKEFSIALNKQELMVMPHGERKR